MADLPLLWVSMSWKIFSFGGASSPWTPTRDSHYALAISSAVPLFMTFLSDAYAFAPWNLDRWRWNISRSPDVRWDSLAGGSPHSLFRLSTDSHFPCLFLSQVWKSRKTTIDTKIVHVTQNWQTSVKIKRSKVIMKEHHSIYRRKIFEVVWVPTL